MVLFYALSSDFYFSNTLGYTFLYANYSNGGFYMLDVVVIGAGPAGASAALLTAKAGKKHWYLIMIRQLQSVLGLKTIMA